MMRLCCASALLLCGVSGIFPAQAGADHGHSGSTPMTMGTASGVGTGGGSAIGGSAIAGASGGDSQGALMNATKQMQETPMSFNLQNMQVQGGPTFKPGNRGRRPHP